MPLRAIVAGETITSPFLSIEEWQDLIIRVKKDKLEVRLPCCNELGYLRTSSRGLAHFVHHTKSDNCTSKPETWQHLKAKAEIARACRDAGWETITEASGDGWRADVLARHGNAQIAFEVQWSPQTLVETELRQQRYADADVRCCWLFKTPPPAFAARGDVPLFKLEISGESCNVIFNPFEYDRWGYKERHNQILDLQTFIRHLLTGNIKFSEEMVALRHQDVVIQFIQIDCWKCKKLYDIYYTSPLDTGCGDEIHEDLFFDGKVISEAIKFTQSPQGKHIQMGSIKERYSNTLNESYMSFGCRHCDAICGSFFLHHEIMPYRDSYTIRGVHVFTIDLQEPISIAYPHWCYSEGKQFCSEQYPTKP